VPNCPASPDRAAIYGGHGGGGAGATNDGTSATNSPTSVAGANPQDNSVLRGKAGLGGTTSNYSVPLCPSNWTPTPKTIRYQSPVNVNTTGGMGVAAEYFRARTPFGTLGTIASPSGFAIGGGVADALRNPLNQPGVNIFCFTPAQPAFNAVRSGAGGGYGGRGSSSGTINPDFLCSVPQFGGGGGGGGGRGNAGNPVCAGGGGG
jgi:hypothetical protein